MAGGLSMLVELLQPILEITGLSITGLLLLICIIGIFTRG